MQMRPDEELQLTEGVQTRLSELRRQAERFPEGHSTRVLVENYLDRIERQVDDTVQGLRGIVGPHGSR
jgi:hypothetical protein